ncbi:MAG: type II toxin-antitoxin system HicA family toxin [Desulfuromonadales bacterium]
MSMNSRNKKTLEAIFSDPVNGAVQWRLIETLLISFGAVMVKGNGSRVSFLLRGRRADFHRPHPGKEALRYRVRAVRDFLIKVGIQI